jgi:hypothetical protein
MIQTNRSGDHKTGTVQIKVSSLQMIDSSEGGSVKGRTAQAMHV